MTRPVISFCTVVRNRLHHLRQTLPVNLAENKDQHIEFLILDYNSSDGLETYLKENFAESFHSNRLTYYKYPAADYFIQSHSRNMAFKLAQGDIVCNIDADNYAGPGYAEFVMRAFESNEKIFITGIENPLRVMDANGKLCVRKSDFLETTGYDEAFTGHGYEDYDLVHRLQMHGLRKQTITTPAFLKAIAHPDAERIAQEKTGTGLHSLYVHYIHPESSEILFFMLKGTVIKGTVVNNHAGVTHEDHPPGDTKTTSFFKYSMTAEGWTEGSWQQQISQRVLEFGNARTILSIDEKAGFGTLKQGDHLYYKVADPAMINEGLLFYMQVTNREKMLRNLESKIIAVNKSYGEGLVYKN